MQERLRTLVAYCGNRAAIGRMARANRKTYQSIRLPPSESHVRYAMHKLVTSKDTHVKITALEVLLNTIERCYDVSLEPGKYTAKDFHSVEAITTEDMQKITMFALSDEAEGVRRQASMVLSAALIHGPAGIASVHKYVETECSNPDEAISGRAKELLKELNTSGIKILIVDVQKHGPLAAEQFNTEMVYKIVAIALTNRDREVREHATALLSSVFENGGQSSDALRYIEREFSNPDDVLSRRATQLYEKLKGFILQ